MMQLWEIWWVWMTAALVLAIFELFVPTFIFVGFAFGAAVVSILLLVGMSFTLAWALVVFAFLSVIAWIAARLIFGVRKGQRKTFDRDINEEH